MKTILRTLLAGLAAIILLPSCQKVDYNSLPIEVPTLVNMGLSVQWTDINVGAVQPYDIGYYYAWGEFLPKGSYSSGNYLDTNYDAVLTKLGSPLRTPTKAEWEELLSSDNCDVVWEEKYSDEILVPGLRITSKKPGFTDKSIFLPAGGFYSGGSRVEASGEPHCRYWASTQNKENGTSWHMNASKDDGTALISTARYFGMNLRAVCP